jgi:hypothetical protein
VIHSWSARDVGAEEALVQHALDDLLARLLGFDCTSSVLE